jgi:hypothetical protein
MNKEEKARHRNKAGVPQFGTIVMGGSDPASPGYPRLACRAPSDRLPSIKFETFRLPWAAQRLEHPSPNVCLVQRVSTSILPTDVLAVVNRSTKTNT